MSSCEASDDEFESADEDIEDIDHELVAAIDSNSISVHSSVDNIYSTKELCDNKDEKDIKHLTLNLTSEHNLSVGDENKISNALTINESDRNSESVNEDIVRDNQSESVIKARKLLRNADRIKMNSEESVSEDRKVEVLNKLANIESANTSRWNNWLSDIKTAALSATTSTVNHASNWSKRNASDILQTATNLTSKVVENVGSVVENVGSVVDNAIGVPSPEEMASSLRTNTEVIESAEHISNKVESEDQSRNDESSGFGLVNLTLNTLERIGKKTIEVITDEKRAQ